MAKTARTKKKGKPKTPTKASKAEKKFFDEMYAGLNDRASMRPLR